MSTYGFSNKPDKNGRVNRWYFGPMAGCMTAVFTHPLDLLKVHQQTGDSQLSLSDAYKRVSKQGYFSFYSGLSANLLKQVTNNTTKSAGYYFGKMHLLKDSSTPFLGAIVIAAISGAMGGFVGTPADMINVRMENDIKLAPELRNNYKNVFHGLYTVVCEEGIVSLFTGMSTAAIRGSLMAVGQLAFYDEIRSILVEDYPEFFQETFKTHFLASFVAGTVATVLTLPMDTIKTRQMSSKPTRTAVQVVKYTFKTSGIRGFYKGFLPSFIRITPQTCILYFFLEQLKTHFGKFQKTT